MTETFDAILLTKLWSLLSNFAYFSFVWHICDKQSDTQHSKSIASKNLIPYLKTVVYKPTLK